jgi:hypothetical protein
MSEVKFVLNKFSNGYITRKEVGRLNGMYGTSLDVETCIIISDLMNESPCFINELYQEMISNGLTMDDETCDDETCDEEGKDKFVSLQMLSQTITTMDFDQIIIERMRSKTCVAGLSVSYMTLARILHAFNRSILLPIYNETLFSFIADTFYVRSYISDMNYFDASLIRVLLDQYISSKIEYGNDAKIGCHLTGILVLNGNGMIRPIGSCDTLWVNIPPKYWASSIVRAPRMAVEEYEEYKMMEMLDCLHPDVKKAMSKSIGYDINSNTREKLDTIDPKVFATILGYKEIDPSSYGMIVPLHMKNTMEQYILDNIWMYTGIITGYGTGISNVPDGAIFADLMRYFYYTSREDMIDKFRGYLPILAFTPLSDRILNLSVNTKLTTLENLNEALDECELIMVNIDNVFYTFEVDEAKNCWNANKMFLIPTDLSILIPKDVMEEVVNLCRCYDSEGYKSLRDCIASNIRRSNDIDIQNDHIKLLVINMEKVEKVGVENMLMEIFHAAMYLRGWDGTPGVFPLKSDQTNPGWDVQLKSTNSLIVAREYCNKHMEIFNMLTCYEFNGGKFKVYQWCGSLMEYFDDMMKQNQCIRVASSILCNSTAYYIEFLFGHNIDGYDHHIIEDIW